MAWKKAFPFLVERVSGDAVPFIFTLYADGAGVPISSFAGYELTFTLKISPDDPQSARLPGSKSISAGTITTRGRRAIWRITPQESAQLPVGTEILFDLEISTPDGAVRYTPRRGRLLFHPQITTPL